MKKTIIACSIIILAGCSTVKTTYVAPESEAGKACVAQCHKQQSQCIQKQNELANNAYNQCLQEADAKAKQCEMKAQADYEACLKYSSTPAACMKSTCFKQQCFENVDTSACASAFDACFQSCGGRIVQEEVK